MEKKMENYYNIQGVYRRSGKENGNYWGGGGRMDCAVVCPVASQPMFRIHIMQFRKDMHDFPCRIQP